MRNCDILVIGSGVAGLSFALHCADFFKDKKILVLSKGRFEDSNTFCAQGGIAAVMDRIKDSYEQHIEDTLRAGDGLCNPEIVEMVVRDAPARMLELMDWGVEFDFENSELELAKEGGHSKHRILHCKDHTGTNVLNVLVEQCKSRSNIELRENHHVIELLKSDEKNECIGALVSDELHAYPIYADYVMLATGGAGQVYACTSNPEVATGDGIAMAKKIGAHLHNMAFVQFHPTVLHTAQNNKPFLISEAVRGFGAILRNAAGEDFMYRYDPRGSLATRDIVSRAIFYEMKNEQTPNVWLDLRHLDKNEFERKFPSIYAHISNLGIEVDKEMIPVKPAAHYFCGGVQTDSYGQTSVSRLLASGECAATGLHGANRLASNSLLEALVFSHRAAKLLRQSFVASEQSFSDISPVMMEPCDVRYKEIMTRVQEIMTEQVGIIRTKNGLEKAKDSIERMMAILPANKMNVELKEVENVVTVAHSVIENSLQQEKNCGGFFIKEYELENNHL